MSTTGEGARWLLIRNSLSLPDSRFSADAVSERAMARTEASDLATKLLRKMGITKYPINLEEVGVYLGIRFGVSTLAYESALDLRHENAVSVWAKKELLWIDKRMAYAHAIGHLLLHPFPDGKVRSCDRGQNVNDVFELEAWAFARSLLMPFEMVKAEWLTGSFRTAAKLAGAFQVPEKDMVRRLKLLQD